MAGRKGYFLINNENQGVAFTYINQVLYIRNHDLKC